ncbi:MAG: hypothetical protein H2057_05190 [Alphaproteobacteria bacterium]|nr:hypothetical protein [Alphaproteobacteria bacterium]
MKKLYGWVLCLGLLTGPVFGTADEDGGNSRTVHTSVDIRLDEEVDHTILVPNNYAFQKYLRAQLDFFSQETLQPAFMTTKALYGFFFATLSGGQEAVDLSVRMLLQDVDAFTPETREVLNSFLRSVDQEPSDRREITPKITILDTLIRQAEPQVQSCRGMTFRPASALALLSRNRDFLHIMAFLKDKSSFIGLRQQVVLAFHEKVPEPIFKNAMCGPELRQELDIDVRWDTIFPLLCEALQKEIAD